MDPSKYDEAGHWHALDSKDSERQLSDNWFGWSEEGTEKDSDARI